MSTPSPISAGLLDRYLAGECSPEEVATVRTILECDPMLAALAANDLPAQVPVDDLWAEFGERKARQHEIQRMTVVENTGINRKIRGWKSWMAVAGLVAAVVIAIPAIWNHFQHPMGPETTSQYITQRGQFATIAWPDGSQMFLAPESKAIYRQNRRGVRTVTLAGQASFTVKHASTSPFTVTAGDVITRVLGTTFDVRWYPDDADVQVSVTTGRVAIDGIGEPVIVNPGQTVFASDSNASVTTRDRTMVIANWAQGRLEFPNTSVRELLETLRRWYGYEFRLADSALASRHISTVLDISKPAETLRMIGSLLDVGVIMKGDTVILAGRSAPASSPRWPPRRQPVTVAETSNDSKRDQSLREVGK